MSRSRKHKTRQWYHLMNDTIDAFAVGRRKYYIYFVTNSWELPSGLQSQFHPHSGDEPMQCVGAIKTEARRNRNTRLGSQRGLHKNIFRHERFSDFSFSLFVSLSFTSFRRQGEAPRKKKERHWGDGEEMA